MLALVLGAWAGSLGMAALTAAIAFPAMKRLSPTLPAFQTPVEHHWSIAAGHIAHPVLTIAVWAQAVFGFGALLVLRGATREPTRGARLLRASVIGACALSLASITLVQGWMTPPLKEYWSAATDGRVEEAARAKQAFDALHPWSSRLLSGTLVLVLVSAGLACVAAGPREAGR